MNGHHTPRLRRQYVFLMGMVTGMTVATAAFFLTAAARNTGTRDYRLAPPAAHIYERGELGLVASSARLAAPVFVPVGEAVALDIEPEPVADLVVFDVGRRIRVDLIRGGAR